jgi:hypothetical protein
LRKMLRRIAKRARGISPSKIASMGGSRRERRGSSVEAQRRAHGGSKPA